MLSLNFLIFLSIIKPTGVEFQVYAYYSAHLFWFGFGFFVPALHPPAFLQHPKLIMPMWVVMTLMKSISFRLVIALPSPGRNPVVFGGLAVSGGCSSPVWGPGALWPCQGQQAGGAGTRWAPGSGFACPVKADPAGVPCQEESRELGVSHLRVEAGQPGLSLLPLRASSGHWHCSCGLLCLLL